MSHTTSIENIVFSDIAALTAAVTELNTKGVRCSLVKGGTPRAYYANQAGMGAADYVLKLEDCQYDIGFYQNAAKKGLEARTDLFANHVQRVLGVQAQKGESAQMAALGKLNQTYAIHAATRKAIQQGRTVRRVNNNDGSVRLVIGGFN